MAEKRLNPLEYLHGSGGVDRVAKVFKRILLSLTLLITMLLKAEPLYS
ncbi:MAG: hypothetical protein QXU69_08140 [Thermofilaceae archaeon]